MILTPLFCSLYQIHQKLQLAVFSTTSRIRPCLTSSIATLVKIIIILYMNYIKSLLTGLLSSTLASSAADLFTLQLVNPFETSQIMSVLYSEFSKGVPLSLRGEYNVFMVYKVLYIPASALLFTFFLIFTLFSSFQSC